MFLASAIFFEVNWRYLSCVISMTWMVLENTMQDAVSSENLRIPSTTDRLIEVGRANEIADRQINEDHFGHNGLLAIRSNGQAVADCAAVAAAISIHITSQW